MKIYFDKILGQSGFGNILFKPVKVDITVLAYSSTKYYLLAIFGPFKWGFFSP